MCVHVDPRLREPKTSWMTPAQVADQAGIARAREMLGQIVEGGAVVTDRADRVVQLLSCPPDLRDTLRAQIADLMMAGGADAIRTLNADDKRRLASTSSEPAVLSTLAQDRRSWKVRFGVAENPATPDFVLAILIEDKASNVVQRALSHRNLSAQTLNVAAAKFIAGDEINHAATLARHPNLSADSCQDLLKWVASKPEGGRALEWIATRVLEHANLPDDVRDRVIEQWLSTASRGSWKLKALADCPAVPAAELDKLARLSDDLRWRAERTLRRRSAR